ncbi:hypothetical protein BJ508DRAFT_377433 [Ascobolus immersus RN42]|uniref:DUF7598 domain-containing protein n=1 Tax=Ascobolus immersus RN42 TaxID=1160509 RepID=A0A3N4IDT8_ASCIM|nr:hypothetical protein BJ508DRAFT_377433 [Ascobolus immersus RN42]
MLCCLGKRVFDAATGGRFKILSTRNVLRILWIFTFISLACAAAALACVTVGNLKKSEHRWGLHFIGHICNGILLAICGFLVLTELPSNIIEEILVRRIPMFSARASGRLGGLLALGVTEILLLFFILEGLNESPNTKNMIGGNYWRLYWAGGIVIGANGFMNIIASAIVPCKFGKDMTAKQVRFSTYWQANSKRAPKKCTCGFLDHAMQQDLVDKELRRLQVEEEIRIQAEQQRLEYEKRIKDEQQRLAYEENARKAENKARNRSNSPPSARTSRSTTLNDVDSASLYSQNSSASWDSEGSDRTTAAHDSHIAPPQVQGQVLQYSQDSQRQLAPGRNRSRSEGPARGSSEAWQGSHRSTTAHDGHIAPPQAQGQLQNSQNPQRQLAPPPQHHSRRDGNPSNVGPSRYPTAIPPVYQLDRRPHPQASERDRNGVTIVYAEPPEISSSSHHNQRTAAEGQRGRALMRGSEATPSIRSSSSSTQRSGGSQRGGGAPRPQGAGKNPHRKPKM